MREICGQFLLGQCPHQASTSICSLPHDKDLANDLGLLTSGRCGRCFKSNYYLMKYGRKVATGHPGITQDCSWKLQLWQLQQLVTWWSHLIVKCNANTTCLSSALYYHGCWVPRFQNLQGEIKESHACRNRTTRWIERYCGRSWRRWGLGESSWHLYRSFMRRITLHARHPSSK